MNTKLFRQWAGWRYKCARKAACKHVTILQCLDLFLLSHDIQDYLTEKR